MKNWKPEINEDVWIPDLPVSTKRKFTNSEILKRWYDKNLIFRTKALAQSALKDVKKVLKKARKA